MRALAVSLAGAALICGTAVQAQYETHAIAQQELRDYIGEYAHCMVRYHRGEARNLVVSNTPNERLDHDFATIYTSKPIALATECDRLVIRDGHAFVLQPDIYRGMLAQHLILAEMKVPEAGNFANRAPLSQWTPPSRAAFEAGPAGKAKGQRRAALEQAFGEAVGRAWLSKYGECVVRGNAKAAYDWIVSKPASAEEKAALGALQPAFAGCLAQGESLAFGKSVLQGTVAINYYRLAMAAPVSVNGVAG